MSKSNCKVVPDNLSFFATLIILFKYFTQFLDSAAETMSMTVVALAEISVKLLMVLFCQWQL